MRSTFEHGSTVDPMTVDVDTISWCRESPDLVGYIHDISFGIFIFFEK